MKKQLFAVFSHNNETGITRVLNIFDDSKLADAELRDLSEILGKHLSSQIFLFVRPCSFCYSKKLADDILMTIVNTVAKDLMIAESGFKKGNFKNSTFHKFSLWFNFAQLACRRGSAILDILNDD